MKKQVFNVINFLPFGRENALPMKELALRMGVDPRTARKLVYEARQRGAVICSMCSGDRSDGYFRPNTAEEAAVYVRMQKCRIKSAKAALKPVEDFVSSTKSTQR